MKSHVVLLSPGKASFSSQMELFPISCFTKEEYFLTESYKLRWMAESLARAMFALPDLERSAKKKKKAALF